MKLWKFLSKIVLSFLMILSCLHSLKFFAKYWIEFFLRRPGVFWKRAKNTLIYDLGIYNDTYSFGCYLTGCERSASRSSEETREQERGGPWLWAELNPEERHRQGHRRSPFRQAGRDWKPLQKLCISKVQKDAGKRRHLCLQVQTLAVGRRHG